ncbi:MAG: hypothetical protein P8Z78_03145 [Gammaproteobacteria bacterium]
MRNRGYAATIRFLPFLLAIALPSAPLAQQAPPGELQPSSKPAAPSTAVSADDADRRRNTLRIPRFHAVSLTGGYNRALFSADASCETCRVRVSVTVRDSEAELASLAISFNGVALETIRPGGRTYTNDDLLLDLSGVRPPRSGRYDLLVEATNVRGQSRSRSIPLRVDLEAPRIISVSPADGATLFADGPTMPLLFEVAASDDTGIASVRVTGDREHNPRWRGRDRVRPYRVRIRHVEHGTREWTVRVRDRQGNLAESKVTLTVRPRPATTP